MAATSASTVMSVDVPWSELPMEVIEWVLSFLPVPVLCRLRTVCKGWNELLCGPRFHDLYEKNGKEHREVCFLTRFKVSKGYSEIDTPVKGTTCFLDLSERRWYSIKRSEDRGFDMRVVAMDEGLVAEFCCKEQARKDDDYISIVRCVKMSDPISKLSFTLQPPFYECPRDDELPTLVVAADRSSWSFRVFLMNNTGPYSQFLWIYDSSKLKQESQKRKRDECEWRRVEHMPIPQWKWPTDLGTRARSAVFFHGDLYVIVSPFWLDVCSLVRYDCEKDTWSMLRENLPEQPAQPQLLVSSNRLFMRFFRMSASTGASYRMTKYSAPAVEALEMVEVQIPENELRPVFRIPSARLVHYLGKSIYDLACVVPCVSTDGSCSSVALVSSSSGKVIMYNVVSGLAEILPTHPLGEAMLNQNNPRRRSHMRYCAMHKNLSFRDILKKAQAHPPIYVPEHPLGFVRTRRRRG